MGVCSHGHRPLPDGTIQEIQGLLKLHKDGHVERLPVMPDVPCTWPAATGVTSFDVIINAATGVWARLYAPNPRQTELPLLVYFHGGGFCVGSASWRCYHEFLARLAAAAAGFVVVSDSPQLSTTASRPPSGCGSKRSNPSLAGRGGPRRRRRAATRRRGSALTLEASDLNWRLALPAGADRDHPWCNPLSKSCSPRLEELKLPAVLVCVAANKDLLRDRNLKFCEAMERAGKRVECAVYGSVGHAFQVLGKSHVAMIRTEEMLAAITSFTVRSCEDDNN